MLLVSVESPLFSQAYNRALGLRLDSGIGFTYKERLGDRFTVEGLVRARPKQDFYQLGALAEFHNPLIFKFFNIYYGAGLHYGYYDTPEHMANPFGISGILGTEITLGRINLSYDVKLDANLIGGTKVIEPSTGISIRYVMAKKKRFGNKKDRHIFKKSNNKKKEVQNKKNRKISKSNKKENRFPGLFKKTKEPEKKGLFGKKQ